MQLGLRLCILSKFYARQKKEVFFSCYASSQAQFSFKLDERLKRRLEPVNLNDEWRRERGKSWS